MDEDGGIPEHRYIALENDIVDVLVFQKAVLSPLISEKSKNATFWNSGITAPRRCRPRLISSFPEIKTSSSPKGYLMPTKFSVITPNSFKPIQVDQSGAGSIAS